MLAWSAMLLAKAPRIAANVPAATTQTTRVGSSVRTASRLVEPSRRSRDRGTTWRGERLAPRSRRAAISTAAPPATNAPITNNSITHGRAPVTGWSCSAQPNGVSQRSQPAPEARSAAMRRSRAIAIRAPPIAWAPRWLPATWHASAPSVTNNTPGRTTAAAISITWPVVRSPGTVATIHSDAVVASHSAPHSSRSAASTTAVAPERVTAPQSTSSQRPASSSPRSARAAANTAQAAASTAMMPTTRNSTYPPTDARSRGCRRKGATQGCPGTRPRTVGAMPRRDRCRGSRSRCPRRSAP